MQRELCCCTHLQLLLVLVRDGQNIMDVVSEAEIAQSALDVFACNGLLGFLLADIVGFRGDERDELDAAFHE